MYGLRIRCRYTIFDRLYRCQPRHRPVIRSFPTRDEHRGRPPSVQIRGCTCFRLRRLSRQVTQIYDRVLAPTGLRVTQFSLLSMLAWKDGQPMGCLADALDMERTTLTRNLKPLIDGGLVALVRSQSDARQREVWLTADGRARQIDAKGLWRVAQNEVNRTIGEVRVAALHQLMDGLLDTLHAHKRSTASA